MRCDNYPITDRECYAAPVAAFKSRFYVLWYHDCDLSVREQAMSKVWSNDHAPFDRLTAYQNFITCFIGRQAKEDTSMTREEFENRTGIYPCNKTWQVIERKFNNFQGDMDTFCDDYKKNRDSIAKSIQCFCDMDCAWCGYSSAIKVAKLTGQVGQLRCRIEQLENLLEQERKQKE